MMSFKIRWEMVDGRNLVSFDSGSLEEVVDLIRAEMLNDRGRTIRAGYVVEAIDENGECWELATV